MKTNVIRRIRRTSAVLWLCSPTWSCFILRCPQLWCDVEPWALTLLLTAALTHKLSFTCAAKHNMLTRGETGLMALLLDNFFFFHSSDFFDMWAKITLKIMHSNFFPLAKHLQAGALQESRATVWLFVISGATFVPCKLKLCSTKNSVFYDLAQSSCI